MLPKINPLSTDAWSLLEEHYSEMKNLSIKDFFIEDAERFKNY